jgi:hypothetical protein
VPPITEDDLNLGIQSLLNKGKIPKDVDLTPAFEKGAPPVTFKGMKIHDKKEMYAKTEVLTGGTQANNVKYDLQPMVPRVLKPVDRKTKTLLATKTIGGL